MQALHIPCPGCGATVVALNPRCRYCGRPMDPDQLEDDVPPVVRPVSLGMDSFALLVAMTATAFPIHALLAGMTPPYAVPEIALGMDLRFAVTAAAGVVVGGLWQPRTLRGLLVLLLFAFHGFAFVQMTSWRSGATGLDPTLLGLAFSVGGAAIMGAFGGMLLRGLFRSAAGEDMDADVALG